ncbi:unnamed protein product [Mytilus edulis]|uniref:Uncharacterized protein n=1 Tax=Mytilus edulis TaxID=6550 RepID=A0A8S3VC50_MYTED|nr:unnamed protein product [Mytilus edulis]
MAEACGYHQHNDVVNAIKHKPQHQHVEPPEKASELSEMKEQIKLLTDLVSKMNTDQQSNTRIEMPPNNALPRQSRKVLKYKNIELVTDSIDIVEGQDVPFNPSKSEDSSVNMVVEFYKEFHLSEDLNETQLLQLQRCLYENRYLFVTKDNPDLGFSSLIEHKINFKPNAISKHQNPYKLPPYKREILREQLDDLLRQGIITPVSESEELLITSPVVLVANVDKKESKNFKFCCDFRHSNAKLLTLALAHTNLRDYRWV